MLHEQYVLRDSRGIVENRAANSLEALQKLRLMTKSVLKAERVVCYIQRADGRLTEVLSMGGER